MYFCFGEDFIVETLCESTSVSVSNYAELTREVREFFCKRVPKSGALFTTDINFLQSKEELYYFDIFGASPLNEKDLEKHKSAFEKSILELNKTFPSYTKLVNIIVSSVLFGQSTTCTGGSISDYPGIIWFHFKSDWNAADLVEGLVHEFCHQFILFDDLVYSHFNESLRADMEFPKVPSAISGKSLCLPAAFHSAIVASEILCFRKRILEQDVNRLIHPSSKEIQNNLNQTIRVLGRRHAQSFCRRGLDILSNVTNLL